MWSFSLQKTFTPRQPCCPPNREAAKQASHRSGREEATEGHDRLDAVHLNHPPSATLRSVSVVKWEGECEAQASSPPRFP
ncbi:unnamed protein product [Protopolystoma xenopodis]|uniref:Uncharacterized protein n=1 Tax=Protopolystoma xenopodis TaxID=117903 RepID=A0A448XRV4_9PLAT|nr:unnamed protein product [Protopolystoma xenopodis]